ncbi:MAG: AAA family ATPase [Anaerolineae bacterium]|nr:AAA family ATPase [Anaerolineae bacterium]
MIRRSVTYGLLVGLALVVASLYPLFAVWVYPRVLHTPWPSPPNALRTLFLVISCLAAAVAFGLAGSLVVIRSRITSPIQGLRAGAISGQVAALVFYILLVSPTYGLLSAARLWADLDPILQQAVPAGEPLLRFAYGLLRSSLNQLGLCLLAGAVVGGLEGVFVGLLRRRSLPSNLSLVEAIADPEPRRRWFTYQDDVWGAGLLAGLISGVVLWIWETIVVFSGLRENWPQLPALIVDRGNPVLQALLSQTFADLLSPLLLLVVLGTGALAVLLLHDPPRRHLSRFHAVLLSGVVAAVLLFLAVGRDLNFVSGLSRYWALGYIHEAQPLNPSGDVVLTPDDLAVLRAFVHAPNLSLPLFYLLPLGALAALLVAAVIWIAPQAAFYGLVLPKVFKRPVDRAGRIAHALHSEPSILLPRIYRLFGEDAHTLQVLPHLAFIVKDPPAKQVTAAYHTLVSRPDQMGQAMAIIRQTLAEQGSWRWRVEVGELYRVLEDGLAVKTLDQILAIEPPPQEITSSLPVLLAKSCEGLGRVLAELGKVERVDDLGTKIIFLNSTQAALLDLRRYINRDGQACRACATLYPEVGILEALLDHWQGLIGKATQDLQGRANLQLELKVHRTVFAPRVCACLVASNQGLNVAQNVRLRLTDGEGYRVPDGAEQSIDIISPQETRDLEFWITPDAPRRLRLAWELTYDDAVDTGRRVTFADALDLSSPLDSDLREQDRSSFQRIFPIPYVTGTPLRSGEMFVGRQDVFDFVTEHLLGVYQNNVIVLHGQRRTGKTSILYRLREVLASTHIAVLIDMQGKAARGMADFLYAISDDIVYALESHGIPAGVDLPERAEYEASPEFTFRSRFLRSVTGLLDNRNLLLMFDEFEELEKRVEDGRLEPEVFDFLRNLMQHESRLDFIFSGTHKLEELCSDYWSILFNIAVYKRITFLDREDVRSLVTEPVAPAGLEYDPLAVDRIIQVTAGHPYFTQVVCHEMVAYHNETRRNYLTAGCVDQALERIVERGEAHFKYIWAGATPEEQRVMLAVTDLLPDADSGATPTQIAAELDCKGYELSEEDLTRALAHLQAKDILVRSGPQSSLYRFKIDLIRRWISISRPAVAAIAA